MKTIELKHPLTVDGVEVRQLSLRRPKVRDLERMDKVSGDIAKSVMLIADLAELTPDQVRELDTADYAAVMGGVEGFLGVQDEATSES